MPDTNTTGRSFSDDKHASGRWRTNVVVSRNPLVRGLLSYCSFKRSGVDTLAKKIKSKTTPDPALVVDLGAGQGAYAHWFLGRAPATILAIDWSREALARIPPAQAGRGKILRICADAGNLPLKPESTDALYSLDTLGHVPSIEQALDEMLRITKPGAPLFLHSECGDYRSRWPDTMLTKRIGHDFLAAYDDHRSILPFADIRSLYTRRFLVESIFSAAGLTGWLTGYPEKYQLAFAKAGVYPLAWLTALFALVKKLPVAGAGLRILNATLNRLELALGLVGGGSCCARMRKPGHGKVFGTVKGRCS